VTRPLILLTNDDGIDSPGLLAAAEAVFDLGELLIVAPTTQQTGMGRSIPPATGGAVGERILRVKGHDLVGYALPGSPARVVLYGVLALAPRRPDLVISGINYGENLGTSVTTSGTVGAALQAAELGIRGLAVSLETAKVYHYTYGNDLNWSVASQLTRYFAGRVLRQSLPDDVDVLKIDVPSDATPETPWRITRQARQSYYETFRVSDQPAAGGQVKFDYRINVHWETVRPDSDIYAFAHDRVVAVTPLSQDLTSRTDLRALESLFKGTRRSTSRRS